MSRFGSEKFYTSPGFQLKQMLMTHITGAGEMLQLFSCIPIQMKTSSGSPHTLLYLALASKISVWLM
jgi:hypothetical protein